MTANDAPMSSPHPAPRLSRPTLWLMAVACGICVANICYNQPLLGDFADYFHASAAQVGWVAMASQAGYGLGILFFLPLGDRVERGRLIQVMIWLCAAFLVGTALAPNLATLILGNLLVGATAMSAQVLIPLAVELSPAEQRTQTVGVLMTGLLGGILLARTLAGYVGDTFGWRAMFGLAAVMMAALGVLLRGRLPHRRPSVNLPYRDLMLSLWHVLRTQRRLWRPSFITALSFGSFTAFWTTLSFVMADRFHLGATETGLFGLVGLAGALAVPHTGKLADRRGPVFTVTIALALSVLSFAVMGVWVTIPVLILCVLFMDIGVQTVQVSEQGTVLALLPEARNRINTLYMVARFAGGAAGSLAGAYAWSYGHWTGVCVLTVGINLAALILHRVAHRREAAALPAEAELSRAA